MSNEPFELRPGALVVGPGGALGWIQAVLAIPGGGQVSGFVLREGLLFDRGIRVPIEAVERTEDRHVRVGLSAAQINDLADVQARGFSRSTAPDEHRIEAGRRVVYGDGEAGSLAGVIVDPTSDQATHLVIRRGDVIDREVIVPLAWVRALTDDPIVLDATRQRVDSSPEYRADDEITDAVSRVLWYRSSIQPNDVRYVKVHTRDGVVQLSGKTRTEQSRLAIEERVRDVRGVLDVQNEIRTFEALAAAVQALGERSQPQHGRPGGTSLVPLHLDGRRSGQDADAGIEVAAPELDVDAAPPLRAIA